MSNEPYADVREMYMAHTMFRREFGLLPALIGGVSAADAARAQVVAQHFELIQSVLHHHHHAEDVYLWPRVLAARGRTRRRSWPSWRLSTRSSTRSSPTSRPGCGAGRRPLTGGKARRWPRPRAASRSCSPST